MRYLMKHPVSKKQRNHHERETFYKLLYIHNARGTKHSVKSGNSLLKLVKKGQNIDKIPDSFQTIMSWMKKRCDRALPSAEILEVPLPTSWNTRLWPNRPAPVQFNFIDPIAALAVHFITPRNWADAWRDHRKWDAFKEEDGKHYLVEDTLALEYTLLIANNEIVNR